MEVIHGRGYAYSIQYDIVWCVKYRHKIITQEVEKRLLEIIEQVAKYEEFQILECNTDKDHIHILVNCSPHHYIPNIIQKLKGASSKLLMQEFNKELREKLYGGHIWNPSYFIATVSENTEQQIKQYIKNQKGREERGKGL